MVDLGFVAESSAPGVKSSWVLALVLTWPGTGPSRGQWPIAHPLHLRERPSNWPSELAKRRQKLSPEHDKKIDILKKHIELLNAKISDIRNEQLREEFADGFRPVLNAWAFLRGEYDANGFTEDLLEGFQRYERELKTFEDEYEL